MSKVVINAEFCKACGLCLTACKKDVLDYGKKTNSLGYYTVEPKAEENCISCRMCAIMCPEAAIEIYK